MQENQKRNARKPERFLVQKYKYKISKNAVGIGTSYTDMNMNTFYPRQISDILMVQISYSMNHYMANFGNGLVSTERWQLNLYKFLSVKYFNSH